VARCLDLARLRTVLASDAVCYLSCAGLLVSSPPFIICIMADGFSLSGTTQRSTAGTAGDNAKKTECRHRQPPHALLLRGADALDSP